MDPPRLCPLRRRGGARGVGRRGGPGGRPTPPGRGRARPVTRTDRDRRGRRPPPPPGLCSASFPATRDGTGSMVGVRLGRPSPTVAVSSSVAEQRTGGCVPLPRAGLRTVTTAGVGLYGRPTIDTAERIKEF